MPDMVSGPGPLFVSVKVGRASWRAVVWLAKVVDCEDRLTTGTGETPVTLNATDCGLAVTLSEVPIVAVQLRLAVGANMTLMLQIALRARVAGQLLVCA